MAGCVCLIASGVSRYRPCILTIGEATATALCNYLRRSRLHKPKSLKRGGAKMQDFCVTLFSQLAVPLKFTQLAREGCCRCYEWCWRALLDMTHTAHCESHVGKHSQILRVCENPQCCRATSACQCSFCQRRLPPLAQPNTDAEEFTLSYSIGQLSNRWKADMARRSSVHAGGTQCNGGCTRLLLTGIQSAERGALSFQAQAVQDCISDLGNLVWVWQVIRSAMSKCVQSNSQSILWCAQGFVLQAIHKLDSRPRRT